MASRDARRKPAAASSGAADKNSSKPTATAATAASAASSSSPQSSAAASPQSSAAAAASADSPAAAVATSSSSQQQQQLQQAEIIDVWADNFRSELDKIMDIVDDYPYIAMDTEFPGVVMRPLRSYPDLPTSNYHTLKCNVDILKLIQLGLCFTNERGQLPPGNPVWQFNFGFNLSEDFFAPDSIELLKNAGIDFKRHATEGIDVLEFAELLMTSGVVLNPDAHWITFHSGYDYAYFLRMMTCLPLPQEPKKFFDLLSCYFPNIFDLKQLLKIAGDAAAARAAVTVAGSQSPSDQDSEALPSEVAADADSFASDQKKSNVATADAATASQAEEAVASGSLSPVVADAATGETSAASPSSAVHGVSVVLESGKSVYLHHHMGLQAIADDLGLQRIGVQHQAGSDSLLTARVFFALRELGLQGTLDTSCLNCVYGLDNPFVLLTK